MKLEHERDYADVTVWDFVVIIATIAFVAAALWWGFLR